MSKKILLIILVLACLIVEGVFIFKGSNEQEARLDVIDTTNEANEISDKAFKWDVSDT